MTYKGRLQLYLYCFEHVPQTLCWRSLTINENTYPEALDVRRSVCKRYGKPYVMRIWLV